jgi:hypothetical protein
MQTTLPLLAYEIFSLQKKTFTTWLRVALPATLFSKMLFFFLPTGKRGSHLRLLSLES